MSADAPNLFDVAGKGVVVTGGLGQLGGQFSLALAARGARVAIFDLRADDRLAAERFPGRQADDRLTFLAVDVTRRASIEEGLARISAAWGGAPHALINNAALDSPPDAPASENGPFETYPEESWDQVMAVNVKGVFLCSQVVGGAMAQAGRGAVVNICSTYGLVSPDQSLYEYRREAGGVFFKPAAYAASKSALLNLTRYLATYWAGRGVRVNTLTLAGVFNNQDPRFLEKYTARVPLGRMAREDEYNAAIIFLVSDASAYMTGANLVMDGGWTAW
jgi:NAD(P)-dependent dehydrogenase (short-subunit alcohol dehydrogenase family)